MLFRSLGSTDKGDLLIASVDSGEIIYSSLSEITKVDGTGKWNDFIILKSATTNRYGVLSNDGETLLELDYDWIAPKYEPVYPFKIEGFQYTRGASEGFITAR